MEAECVYFTIHRHNFAGNVKTTKIYVMLESEVRIEIQGGGEFCWPDVINAKLSNGEVNTQTLINTADDFNTVSVCPFCDMPSDTLL